MQSTMNARRSERLSRMEITEGPMGYVDGVNLYEYVGSAPQSLVDPLGLQAVEVKGNEWGDWEIEQTEGPPAEDPGNRPYQVNTKITFKPSKKVCCSEIQLVQIYRTRDGRTNKPLAEPPQRKLARDRMTQNGWSIDQERDHPLAWYNYNEKGEINDPKKAGAGPDPLSPAVMDDHPSGQASDHHVIWEFQVVAICKKRGEPENQEGQVYGVLTWGFTAKKGAGNDWDVKLDQPKSLSAPTADFANAVALWNAQAGGAPEQRNHPDQKPLSYSGFKSPTTKPIGR
jgi:hypothetical protein